VILVDTSAWVEFLRGTGSPVGLEVVRLLAAGEPLASCDAVRMELLAGARSATSLRDLRRLLDGTTVLETRPHQYDDAALLYRQCRSGGETVRKLVDCLIAACALAAGIPVLHRDVDFEVLARHTALRTV